MNIQFLKMPKIFSCLVKNIRSELQIFSYPLHSAQFKKVTGGDWYLGQRWRLPGRVIGSETMWGDRGWEGTPKNGKLGRRRLWMVPNAKSALSVLLSHQKRYEWNPLKCNKKLLVGGLENDYIGERSATCNQIKYLLSKGMPSFKNYLRKYILSNTFHTYFKLS